MDYSEPEQLSKEELVKLINAIKSSLASADDAEDFCLWLAEILDVDVRA